MSKLGVVNFTGKCPCGRPLMNSGDGYNFMQTDGEGNIIYATCVHGDVVIDNRQPHQVNEPEVKTVPNTF